MEEKFLLIERIEIPQSHEIELGVFEFCLMPEKLGLLGRLVFTTLINISEKIVEHRSLEAEHFLLNSLWLSK